MKRLVTYTAVAMVALTAMAGAKDKDKDKDRDRDHHDGDRDHHDRSRTIYVIEQQRPVERVVFVGSDGRYYRMDDGRRSYVSGRYYESYPSQYYTPEGRVRVGIRLPF